MKVSVWVVPICTGKGKWTILPKAYTKEGYAKSGIRAHHIPDHRHLDPVELSLEIGEPDCDNCPMRFKCFTTRDKLTRYGEV